jgi:hypothetical protein
MVSVLVSVDGWIQHQRDFAAVTVDRLWISLAGDKPPPNLDQAKGLGSASISPSVMGGVELFDQSRVPGAVPTPGSLSPALVWRPLGPPGAVDAGCRPLCRPAMLRAPADHQAAPTAKPAVVDEQHTSAVAAGTQNEQARPANGGRPRRHCQRLTADQRPLSARRSRTSSRGRSSSNAGGKCAAAATRP